ncbi:MAG TPA: hypothetical protein VEW48_10250 [Thermoanaerobaculia bacterium]|nr:hypothetical protein [Thermoanaerobaculia bacterium]
MKRRGRPSWTLGLILLAGALPLTAQTGYSVRSDGNDKQDDYLYSIDMRTGVATPIGPTGYEDVEGLAFDRKCETLFGVDDVTDRLLACDIATGGCKQVGNLGVDITDTGLAFADDDMLYMSTDAPKNPTRFFQVNRFTGAATPIGDQGQEVTGLAAGPKGIFGLGGDGTDDLVQIDPATGKATRIGSLGSIAPSDGGLDFDADGVLWGIEDAGLRNPSRTFTVDTATGQATVVATVHLANGTKLGGFEGLAVGNGVCASLVGPQTVLEVPAVGGGGLAALAVLITGAGLFVLRRMR